jgi:hypothetical protein
VQRAFIIRFSLAALLISVGCLLLMAGWFNGVGMCFGLAALFYMPRKELHGSISRREAWTLLWVLAFFVAVSLTCKLLVPKLAAKSIERVVRHPAVVFPIWLLMFWGLRCHWQKQKLGSPV